MKTLVVHFDNYAAKDYHYVVDDAQSVALGDHAIVHNGTEFRLVKIKQILAGVSQRATKTVVSVINQATFDDYNERNKQVKEQKDLFVRLDQLLAQESENNKYRMLAQGNSEAAEILKKLGIV